MLYRFQIDFSDIDNDHYRSFDFRVSQHLSETIDYLLTRVLAYCLSYQENLEFSPQGLSDPDSPALFAKTNFGSYELWIDIGNPSAKRIHKASKSAKKVRIYTYKNPDLILIEMKLNQVYKADEIEIYSFEMAFLAQLAKQLEKNNTWSVLMQNNQITLSHANQSIVSEVRQSQFQH